MDSFLSTHFRLAEFDCHDGSDTPPEAVANLKRLCTEALEGIREDWGGPIVVVSGYRSSAHNKAVGGAKLSQHVLGTAADVRPLDMDRMEDFAVCCEKALSRHPAIGGLGLYVGWVHVDIRPRSAGRVARWTGKGFGNER